MNTYVFDPSWHKEHDRLRALESLFDGYSTRRLADLGVTEGWNCLEVGCGGGSIARWLADRVGSTGRVVAVDLDTRFAEGHGRANLDVRKHNIVTDTFEDGSFDLVHARAVLTHIRDRWHALERMISVVRPGGWLVLEDTDLAGLNVAALARYVDPPEHTAVLERIFLSAEAIFAAAGADPSCGAQLIAELKRAGLDNIAGEIHAPIVAGGTESWSSGSIEQLASHGVRAGLVTTDDIERALTLTADRSSHYPLFMITAWGQRPDVSPADTHVSA